MKSNLDSISQLIAPALAQVEAKIQTMMTSDVPLISDVNQHIIQGGKRIRPMVGLLMAGLIQGDITEQHITIAAIIEFIHTATLLHDDVVDDSSMRRGQETANIIWGNETSVLVGDFLYSRAFQLLVKTAQIDLMQVLADASNQMAEGEVLQLMNRHNNSITENTYYEIITAKTAVLFQAICKMTALASQISPKLPANTIELLSEFGLKLGLAFQLIDDALDYQGDSNALGKNIGDDLADGKATLPLIHCLNQSTAKNRALIEKIIVTGELNPEQLNTIQQLILQTKSIGYTLAQAKQYSHEAIAVLNRFPDNQYHMALCQLVDFMIDRQS